MSFLDWRAHTESRDRLPRSLSSGRIGVFAQRMERSLIISMEGQRVRLAEGEAAGLGQWLENLWARRLWLILIHRSILAGAEQVGK